MKTIGLLGGMSWHSTLTYYRMINAAVNEALGGSHSAKIAMYSVDFAEVERNMQDGAWDKNASILTAAAKGVKAAGADFFLICTNTLHKVASEVERGAALPLLHIADATADALLGENRWRQAFRKVGLLGTRFTMAQDFIKEPLRRRGIEVLVPEKERMDELNEIVFKQLVVGEVTTPAKFIFQNTIAHMEQDGAEAIILGCTELDMLVSKDDDFDIPLFDTTEIHAAAAVRRALEK